MTIQEYLNEMQELSRFFPANKDINRSLLEAWYPRLQSIPQESFHSAIVQITEHEKWYPKSLSILLSYLSSSPSGRALQHVPCTRCHGTGILSPQVPAPGQTNHSTGTGIWTSHRCSCGNGSTHHPKLKAYDAIYPSERSQYA